MHPRIAELLAYDQLQRKALLDALSLIPEPLRDRRVDPETWSAAEVLEHLHRVESGIARLLSRSVERQGGRARIGERSRLRDGIARRPPPHRPQPPDQRA